MNAWVIWDSSYAAIELALAPRVLTTGIRLSSNNSFYLASRAFVTDYPDLLARLFDELSLDAGVVSRFLQRRSSLPVGPISPSALQSQQRVADSFQKLGLIPRHIDVAQIVWQAKTK